MSGGVEAFGQKIDRWIKIELYTKEEYGILAQRTTNPQAKVVFSELSAAGDRHARILGRIKELLISEGEDSLLIDTPTYTLIPKPGERRGYATEIEEIYHAMQDHIALEDEMRHAYVKMRDKTRNEEAISLFWGLGEDEKQHHQQLLALIQAFEETYGELLKSKPDVKKA